MHESGSMLEEGERQSSAVLGSMAYAVIVANEDGLVTFMNSFAERLTGWEEKDAHGRYLTEVVRVALGEAVGPFLKMMTDALHGRWSGGPADRHVTFTDKAGREVDVGYRVTSLRDDDGHIAGIVLAFHDLAPPGPADTRRNRLAAEHRAHGRNDGAEHGLRQTVDRLLDKTRTLEAIFDSISDGVAVFDANGEPTLVNPSAEQIVGARTIDKDPARWTDEYGVFFPDGVTPFPYEELPQIRAIRGESSDEETAFVRNRAIPDGVYIAGSGRPLLDAHGVVTGSVVVFRDVSERHRAEEALAQAFSHGRLEVVETILHNIGNAINSVATGVGTIHEMLRNNEPSRRLCALADAIEAHRDDWIAYLETDPQGRQVMPFILALARDVAAQNERLRRTVERVEERVTHITDIVRTQSALEDGRIVRKDVVIRKTILDAVQVLQESLNKRGIRVHVDCHDAPAAIRIQESRFQQLLINLLKNAIEAIDELADSGELDTRPRIPRIRIIARLQEDVFVLDVADNGVGIHRDHFKAIFNPGYSTKAQGSGLGLHSAANYVIATGGRIRPLSDGIGTGTTMRVTWRLSPASLASMRGES